MKRTTRSRLASGLLWIGVGVVAFVVVAVVLLLVHDVLIV